MSVRLPFWGDPPLPRAILKRLHNSTVAGSWVSNVLRLAIGVLLLPLVLGKLSTKELGMYYVLLSLVALAPVIDFGFSPTIVRFAIGQHRAQHGPAAMHRVSWPRFWLPHLIFLVLAGGLILCGPPLLRWFGSGKQMLPRGWLSLLALYSLVVLHLSF